MRRRVDAICEVIKTRRDLASDQRRLLGFWLRRNGNCERPAEARLARSMARRSPMITIRWGYGGTVARSGDAALGIGARGTIWRTTVDLS
ncbi:hypothetical protein E1264_01745 [Actinomadura sp. KC216]|nr:hypothetical protein E1264_01745 [Actinomadura sp. KC216]